MGGHHVEAQPTMAVFLNEPVRDRQMAFYGVIQMTLNEFLRSPYKLSQIPFTKPFTRMSLCLCTD